MATSTAWALAGCLHVASPLGSCTDRDVRLASTLGELPVLQAHPDGTVLTDNYSGCDTDDGFPYAGRQYRPGLDRQAIHTFYATAAAKDGWQFHSENHPPAPGTLVVTGPGVCYTKQVDGTTAYLKVWYPSDLNPLDPAEPQASTELQAPVDLYGVEVTAAHDGEAGC